MTLLSDLSTSSPVFLIPQTMTAATRSGRKPTREKMLAGLLASTHLRLNDRNLTSLDRLERFPNALVLHCFENRLTDLTPVLALAQLQQLIAHNNLLISLPPGFGLGLSKLRRLFLNGNRISVFSGFAGAASSLEELHLAYQSTPEPLRFEAGSLAALPALNFIDISGNRLESLAPLLPLKSLRVLLADANELRDRGEVLPCLSGNQELSEISLVGNPLRGFRDAAVLACSCLCSFNGREVTLGERAYIARKPTMN